MENVDIAQYGILGLVLAGVGIGLWKIFSFIGGLLKDYFTKNEEVMTKICETLEKINDRLEHMDNRLTLLEEKGR